MMSRSLPAGQQLSVSDLCQVMEELTDVSAKWYDIGLQLGLSVGQLDGIKKQYSDLSDCLRETLKVWLEMYLPYPTWSNLVDALRSNTVCKTRLAADLENKYCSTQYTSTTTTYHHASPVQAVATPQVHTCTTPPPQSSASLTQPLVFACPFSLPPHSFYPPPWSAPYYYPLPTGYPISTPFLPPPTSGAASTATPPTIHSAYSQLPQVNPTFTPFRLMSESAEPTTCTPHYPASETVEAVTIPQQPAAAGTLFMRCGLP